MNRGTVAALVGLAALALIVTSAVLLRPSVALPEERAVATAEPDVPATPGPVIRSQPDPDEPEPAVDDRPEGVPEGAEWGVPDMNDADQAVQEARVDAMLALPPPVMKEWGGWDGTMLVPGRVARIEGVLGKPIPPDTLLALTDTQARLAEDAALTVGSYRLGEIDEAQTVAELEATRQAWEKEAKATLGLTDAQYDEVFGLGSL